MQYIIAGPIICIIYFILIFGASRIAPKPKPNPMRRASLPTPEPKNIISKYRYPELKN